ncbi:MAG: hypothetical protein IJK03_06115 [Oscillospiraceae bacterium]|nr:hypothetical protein [Oscillospiraceae bacterium]
MLKIDRELQQNIEEILAQVREIERTLAENDELSPSQLDQISYACSELALSAFAASDAMDQEAAIEDRLLRRELSSALWQIAYHCIDVQVWTGEGMLRSHFGMIGKHCSTIRKMMGLEEEKIEEPENHAPQEIVPAADREISAGDATETALMPGPDADDEIARLKAEIKALREILTSLVLKRDNILLVESKELEALYMRELGSLEAEVFRAESNARYLQRKAEMMQAARNRREEIDHEAIEKTLNEKYEAFRKAYDEFTRKAQEAAERVRKRRENVKNAAAGSSGEEKKETSEEKTREEPAEPSGETKIRDENERLKKLYRKIVKAMHPDLHPDQDERITELFKRANMAYEEGDLRTLEEIAQTIDGEEPENSADLLAALKEEKERLLALIRSTREHIALILSRYPFTKKELLWDPVRLKEEQDKLRARLARAEQRAEGYRKRIAEMERQQDGRPDPEK